MKHVSRFYLFICVTAYTPSAYSSDILEDFTELECDIVLKAKPFEQEDPKKRSDEFSPYTHPVIPLKKGTSTNWCGYVAGKNLSAATPKSVTSVSGTWVIPTIYASTNPTTYSSAWIGIDGYTSETVEQIGTAQEWHEGRATYYAWFEMYPQASFEIRNFPVIPGDTISASIEYKGNNIFLMTISNITRKVYTTIPTVYTTSKNAVCGCAEWIMEAPYMNGILPLAHFSTTLFTQCTATIDGIKGAINNKHWKSDNITMKSPLMIPKATATALSPNGESFSVTWLHE